jgi:ubiquinone/menaquinone biosynthesis C-methylase UbiE
LIPGNGYEVGYLHTKVQGLLMAYYDHIAKRWHQATGYKGGSFKKYVLNDILIRKMPAVAGQAILELGAGNGYFMPLALEHFSGQIPERIVITDGSAKLLSIAEKQFHIPGVEYLRLDVRTPFPFEEASFDLILATMIFNEISTGGLRRALIECSRVLRSTGLLLITVTHPDFVASLDLRNQLKKDKHGILTMPGSDHMRLPIVVRRLSDYQRLLTKTGFAWEKSDVYMTKKVLREKPGLRSVGNKPLGLVLSCRKI